jgi:hypothetical protein
MLSELMTFKLFLNAKIILNFKFDYLFICKTRKQRVRSLESSLFINLFKKNELLYNPSRK